MALSNTNSKPTLYRIVVGGRCQGVGFRWCCAQFAQELSATGWVRNEFDGTVLLYIQTDEAGLEQFFRKLRAAYAHMNPHYSIQSIEELEADPSLTRFSVRY